ncbi:hypothetical protein MMC22_006174 [Lobaria immixta]|nr:hypothetical protein [Lobaria immixta]
MYINALRRFAEASILGRTLPQAFLAPTFGFSFKAVYFCSKHISGQKRQFASAVVTRPPQDNTINYSLHANRTISNEIQNIALSKWRWDPNVWAALLDPYLPKDLRNYQISDDHQGQTVGDIQDVPLILAQARGRYPKSLDLLSYLGIHQKRWKAVVWLMKAILDLHIGVQNARDYSKLKAPFWPDVGMSLKDLSRDAIWADDFIRPLEPTTLDHETLFEPTQSVDVTKASLGQVWQSIACLILQAADCQEGSLESKVIMSYVFQILAHMHHINAFPGSIFMYSQAEHYSMIQRPPTLKLFSSQITAILSDTARRAQDLETKSQPTSVRAKHTSKGHDLSGGGQQYQLCEVNIAIWLDLVLWSCLEGGWIREAAWIATEIDGRSIFQNESWSVISWETLKKQEIPPTNLVVKTAQENTKSRMDQTTGDPTLANYGGEPSLVNVPSRTISREVIVALLDGLTNMADATNSDSNSVEALRLDIRTCKHLLATEGLGLETPALNCTVVRLVEETGLDVMQRPKELERILGILPTHPKEIQISMSQISANSWIHRSGITKSAVSISLLRHNLSLFANCGDINGALRTFLKLQCFMDDNRRQLIKDFVETVTDQDDRSDSAEETNTMFLSQLPVHMLSKLLFLASDAKVFEFGKWLLYSDDVDGTTIPPESYLQPALQPALLRFAAEIADSQLQLQITEKLSVPLSRSVLRALFQCQVSLGKWDLAGRLMLFIRNKKRRPWLPADVTRIAKAILLMEKDSSGQISAQLESIRDAFTLLQKFFVGEYNSYEAGKDNKLRITELRILNQLYKMLKRCPGTLSNLRSPYSGEIRPGTSPIRIEVNAFNYLVEGVVERYGWVAGRTLWELWCFQTIAQGSLVVERNHYWSSSLDCERVVVPNLRTLRIILRSFIEGERDKLKVQKQELENQTTVHYPPPQTVKQSRTGQDDVDEPSIDRSHVDQDRARQFVLWACNIFKHTFGLSPEEIRDEFPNEVWLPDLQASRGVTARWTRPWHAKGNRLHS